jgi:uncharacterized protein YbaP (TraB family)
MCEKDLPVSPKLTKYISQTQHMMLEIDMDDAEMLKKLAADAMFKDGKSLKDFLTTEEFAQLDSLYKMYLGVSLETFQKMKPATVSTLLFTSPKILGCTPPMMLDLVLANVAVTSKMPVTGLELGGEQMAILDSQPMTEQIKALKEIGSNPDKGISRFKELYKIYIDQDSDTLYTYISADMKAGAMSETVFLDQRNIKWIPLIEKQISMTPTFIGVGAGHLGGQNGVVKLLRAKGYTLTPIRIQ